MLMAPIFQLLAFLFILIRADAQADAPSQTPPPLDPAVPPPILAPPAPPYSHSSGDNTFMSGSAKIMTVRNPPVALDSHGDITGSSICALGICIGQRWAHAG